ncbi:MAG: corrinoid protein [Candidatus Aminicenantes bacterium]|nr:corrinoid protein [Candidatus Aminicenantes bacterium]
MSEKIFAAAAEAIEQGDADRAAQIAEQGLSQGINGMELLTKGFVAGINKVGDLFGEGRLFLPELMMSATAMQKVTDIINATFPAGKREARGRVLLGTVEGDLHDIGKTIVAALFKANGFEVKDLGRDVPAKRFIEEAEAFGAHIIGSSALLTTTMVVQKELEQELKKAGLKDKYKTMVGGAPVTQRWAGRIGADAYAEDAGEGVRKAMEMIKK